MVKLKVVAQLLGFQGGFVKFLCLWTIGTQRNIKKRKGYLKRENFILKLEESVN